MSRWWVADGLHSFLSRDGIRPAELIASGQRELAGYGGRLLSGRAIAASRTDSGFDVTLENGVHVTARRLLVTSGLTDELPDVGGLRERWGR